MDTEVKLSDCPEIKELLQVLDQQSLYKEKNDVISLVQCIEHMEKTLSAMNDELKVMHCEVGKLYDNTMKAKCNKLMEKSVEKLRQTKYLIDTFKNNLIVSAKQALINYKEKGKETLVLALNSMKIPFALDVLKKGIYKVSDHMQINAVKTDSIREELHEAGFHLKNVGRAIFGKATKEKEQLKADKDILAKIRSFFERSENTLLEMAKEVDSLSVKLRSSYEKQLSVKEDLKQIKSANPLKSKSSLSKEISR